MKKVVEFLFLTYFLEKKICLRYRLFNAIGSNMQCVYILDGHPVATTNDREIVPEGFCR